MRKIIGFIGSLVVLAFIAAAACAPARAQHSPASTSPLKDQLANQYKVARAEITNGTVTITRPGTVLVIQKPGIVGVPPNSLAPCSNDYKDGAIASAGGFCKFTAGTALLTLSAGEKVYPLELYVNPKKDLVSIFFIECDSCNGLSQQSSHKGGVNFVFPKGYLASAEVGQIEDMIGQVFTIDTGGEANANAQPPQNAQAQPQPTDPPPQPAPAPTEIQLGQTVDQVEAALGLPDKKFTIGAKLIYVYKDVKVTFINGKVTDAQ